MLTSEMVSTLSWQKKSFGHEDVNLRDVQGQELPEPLGDDDDCLEYMVFVVSGQC